MQLIRQYALALAFVMLLVWLVGTLTGGPGWIHLLLTLGVFLIIYHVVVRGTTGSRRGGRS